MNSTIKRRDVLKAKRQRTHKKRQENARLLKIGARDMSIRAVIDELCVAIDKVLVGMRVRALQLLIKEAQQLAATQRLTWTSLDEPAKVALQRIRVIEHPGAT
jgi:hypothetical protein